MREADAPERPRLDRGRFTLSVGDFSFLFRRRMPSHDVDIVRRWSTWRTEAADLSERIKALTTAEDAEAVADEIEAMTARLFLLTEGGPGWVLAATWEDAAYTLEAPGDFPRADLADPDVKLEMGRAVSAELVEFGLDFHHVLGLAVKVTEVLAGVHNEPTAAEVEEVRFFSGARPEATT